VSKIIFVVGANMKCELHRDTDAVGFCSECGSGLCSDCMIELDNTKFCHSCVEKRMRPNNPSINFSKNDIKVFKWLGILSVVVLVIILIAVWIIFFGTPGNDGLSSYLGDNFSPSIIT